MYLSKDFYASFAKTLVKSQQFPFAPVSWLLDTGCLGFEWLQKSCLQKYLLTSMHWAQNWWREFVDFVIYLCDTWWLEWQNLIYLPGVEITFFFSFSPNIWDLFDANYIFCKYTYQIF